MKSNEGYNRPPTVNELRALFAHMPGGMTLHEIANAYTCKESTWLRRHLDILVASGEVAKVPGYNRDTGRACWVFVPSAMQPRLLD